MSFFVVGQFFSPSIIPATERTVSDLTGFNMFQYVSMAHIFSSNVCLRACGIRRCNKREGTSTYPDNLLDHKFLIRPPRTFSLFQGLAVLDSDSWLSQIPPMLTHMARLFEIYLEITGRCWQTCSNLSVLQVPVGICQVCLFSVCFRWITVVPRYPLPLKTQQKGI